jgi:hypothetical protein
MRVGAAPMASAHWLSWGFNLVATLAAAGACFVFGESLGGGLMGAIAALNGGVMASLLASALADGVGRCWRALVVRG